MIPSESGEIACTSNANNTAHPYYVVATGYRHADAANRLMHHLCSWLNLAGHESWMISTDTNAELWTPKLNDAVRAQHYAAKKCPIVLSCDLKIGSIADMGKKVYYQFSLFSDASVPDDAGDNHIFQWSSSHPERRLRLPFLNLHSCTDSILPETSRTEILVLADAFLAAGGKESELPTDATRLTTTNVLNEALVSQLKRAKTLYLFEPSLLSVVARSYGCAVVHVLNPLSWPNGGIETPFGNLGLVDTKSCTNHPPVDPWKPEDFLDNYRLQLADWPQDLSRFVQSTQTLARLTPVDLAWPEDVVLSLPTTGESVEASAWRADRIKQLRVNQQLARWTERSTLREIDGEIYGNYVASGRLPAVAAVVYADDDVEALANTLDSLSKSLLQPSELTVVSNQPSPFGDEASESLTWFKRPEAWRGMAELPAHITGPISHIQAPWILAIKAGATLQPNCLLEFAITAQHSTAAVLYADDDVMVNGEPEHPNFKPHTNVEWLRSTNYLGEALLLRSRSWKKHPERHQFEGAYGFALRMLETQGRSGLAHVDTLLVHGSGHLTDEQLLGELAQVKAHLTRSGLEAGVTLGTQRGLRNVAYQPSKLHKVSVVVPCATQTGYLVCLLQSMAVNFSPLLLEVLVVADTEFADRVQQAVDEVTLPFGVEVVSITNAPYSHAKALNAGAALAKGDILLFADDDTEVTQPHWLEPLCGYFNQPDVATVAPRLFGGGNPDPILCGGPSFLGLGNFYGIYCGEKGNAFESGPYGRLQAAQDVSAFAPHFFLVRTSHFKKTGGFDETNFPLLLPVIDFALRATSLSLRHVWSPLVSVFHQGGTTLAEKKRLPENTLALHQSELLERKALLSRWATALGTDPNYNRNLSLTQLFDLEQNIVVDWQPNRNDRPRTVAVPLASGSGQYRVVEPLNALQNEGRAQSCVVFPINRNVNRVLTSIELVRSGLDRLIVQNAISEPQMARMEEYRVQLPKLGIVHMLDDLFGNLPGKHYLHNYHKREGNTRLRRSLELSDRLVVTTLPLKEYYETFVAETRVIPNSLVESAWFDLPVTQRERKGKLRVGWAGAQQHLGDLDMIQKVVAHFGNQVDWVFMGMCPPSIQPHVKEVHPFVSIDIYPQTLANLDLDIAIAPLEDNPFNTCKSNLRLLEYGAMGWPVVCSDVYPFRTDDPPVSRVSNDLDAWIAAIDAFIANPSLRTEMGKQLKHWVKTRYSLSVHTDAWFKAIFDPIHR